jgi:hypothetical protein
MKKTLWIFLSLIGYINLTAGQPPINQSYSLIKPENYIQSKNYYLLTLLEILPDVNKIIANDRILIKISNEKRNNLSSSLKNCGNIVSCYIEKVLFNNTEIQNIGTRLGELYSTQKGIRDLVHNYLIPSGCYIKYAGLSPKEILIKAWEQDAYAINYAIAVYAEGKSPNYPKIDSISFNVHSQSYHSILYDCANSVLEEVRNDSIFYKPTMNWALRVIEINDRNRASDYEPMELSCNKSAYDRIKTIDWSDFKYTLILVPGAGPDDKEEPLSAGGMLRCRVAAYRWREGIAPFIMVSGGKVHPYKTKYCEAEEMKKYLIVTMHVPENSIIMEPHARHTTTNMRNCARLIIRYGMPIDKPCITSTSKSQSYGITNDMMQNRCIKELGYSPYKNGKRLSETEAEFYPLAISLQIDADEPMDP